MALRWRSPVPKGNNKDTELVIKWILFPIVFLWLLLFGTKKHKRKR